ncbi:MULTISPECIES: glycine cleavage system aminomethyltransferase GcvT [unclassified Arthrobacter]|uniref:glycine cleavage system aminomethyltransferase GcvT n=1 Tax=unclassified Arthrobacter TaxID=235627 RepID=UPI001E3E0C17|nr:MULTISPECIES: glycine cleavage system aminomethyltransferase GcvT [unclassified Arthrobacter]MCC9144432.1 glycine cleavage system aminomethyltransferase GcvT [Arthrobacter sp. zg-Y919]MDK1275658.1 glycine cleavage system aminomethyltransferase GcvT [Arthrobacter sp. zg.Y919]WIB02974.1 glycine cleavage system aminomethyltransferase GcvT [Arthrobacter sp. zg-Y919]
MTEKYTALYEAHKQLGASFTDFGGWQMPLKYSSELAEHKAVRSAAGLFDLSHMGEVEVAGPHAAAFLDYALVGKLSAVKEGRAKYSLITNNDGGIIDDLISYRLADDAYLVVPNAGNADTVAAELAARAEGFDVTVNNISAETSLVAVQGPVAEAILLDLVAAGQQEVVTGMKYYAAATVGVRAGERTLDLLVARTGYTGEDGFEIYVPNDGAAALWTALLAAGEGRGLIPAGLACRDSLRLEAGMPLYGNELTLDTDPYAAGLGPVVALSKEGNFVGRSALEALKEAGPARKLVGLKGSGRRSARSHYPVLSDSETVIGEVTSGAPSPTLGYPIALAYVDTGFAAPGTELSVDLRGKQEQFTVVELPFYRRSKQ